MKPLRLLLYSVLTSVASAGFFKEHGVLYGRQAEELTSTSFPGASTTTTVGATSTEAVFSSTATTLIMTGLTTTWTATPDEKTSEDVVVSGTTATFSLVGTSMDITLTESTTIELSLSGLTTVWQVGDASADVTLEGTATTVTVTGSTSVQWIVSPTTTSVTYSGTTFTFTTRASVEGDAGTETTVTFHGTTVALAIAGTTTTVSLDGTQATLAYEGTEVTLTLSSSETSSSSEESSSTEESSSSEETSSSEESTSTEESTTSSEETSSTSEESTTESTEESTTETGSSTEETSTESTTASESTDTTTSASSSSGPTPALPPGTNPTQCEVVRGPLTPEEEVQLAVLFGDGQGGTTFADYVVSYASQLVAQIADVANIAVGDNDFAFTTAFDTIDVPGVLGLASAAPIYTCFLSTLWAQALSNPQQYAKRAVPSQDDKIKLIVLFEKRATDGMQFDYAELLVDDTNNLIADVQSVAGAAGAAAVGGDLGAYASLFANVDVAQFLSIATEAPIYTEGLSSAFVTALESYSQNVNRPTSTVMVTSVYTSVSTIVTNVVSGTVTVPTTLFSTVVVTSVGPATSGRETYTSHTTETRVGVTSETVSEVVRETTLPNGQVTRVTERVTVGAPGERVTVETVTLGNGRVETRTVTRREGGAAAAATTAITVTKPNVAHYTEVRGGTTYVHTVEIQRENGALKHVVALGTGLLGLLAILL